MLKRKLIWLGLILWLIGCSSEPLTTSLPTSAAVAEIPTQTATAESPANLVPPTWTAVAPSANDPASFPSATPRPTDLPGKPTATIFIPTRTPTNTPTPTVTATPTPYVPFIPTRAPLTDLGPSKMGIHVIQNNPQVMDFIRAAKPAVVKSTGDFGFLAEVKEVSPNTITIGRFPANSQDMTGNPEEKARDYVAEQLRYYQLNPYVDYWEGWNEPDPNFVNMAWYTRFEQERVRELARYGFKAAIGSFPAGVPEMHEFEQFIPAIETAIEHQGILALHEYSAPDFTYLYGDPLPNYPAYPDRGSLTFRYRWYYREFLEPRGLFIPLVITEFGIDGIIGGRPGPAGLGWQDFQDYWKTTGAWGTTDGRMAYINQLAWYDDGMRQDAYVIGATIFTAGGGDRWKSYNIESIFPLLADYINSQSPVP